MAMDLYDWEYRPRAFRSDTEAAEILDLMLHADVAYEDLPAEVQHCMDTGEGRTAIEFDSMEFDMVNGLRAVAKGKTFRLRLTCERVPDAQVVTEKLNDL